MPDTDPDETTDQQQPTDPPDQQPTAPEQPPQVEKTATGNLIMQCPACGGGRLYFKQPAIRTLNFPELSMVTMPNTGNQNCNKCDAWFMLAFPEQQFPMPLALKPMPPPQSDTGIVTAKSIPKIPKGPFKMQ